MNRTVLAMVCLVTVSVMLVPAPNAAARRPPKGGKSKQAYTPPPTPTPPPAPSADLAKFVATNGDNIFAPYSPQVPMPKAELAQLKASFSDRFAKAGLSDRQQYQYAIAVCDGLAQVMTEKTAAASPAAWAPRSAQLRQWIDQLMTQEKAAESAAAGASPSPAH